MPSYIRVGDYGTAINITIKDQDENPVDISSASDLALSFIKPDQTILSKSGIFVSDGTDGRLRYTIIDGDIDMAGIWEIEANIVMPSGNYTSDQYEFRVERIV